MRCCLLHLLLACVTTCPAQFITLRGDQFYDEEGEPFFPMVMNYYADLYYTGAENSLPADLTPFDLSLLNYGRSSLFSATGTFGYPTAAEGPDRFVQDLQEMKAQGFNTVRLVSRAEKKPDEPGFKLAVKQFPTGQGYVPVNLDPPYSPEILDNPACYFYFQSILQACSLANELDMKVILEPVLGDALVLATVGDAVHADHIEILDAFAAFIATHNVTNVLAYEFYGEPSYVTVPDGVERTKAQICELANSWNAAVKAADPDHLTTIGGVSNDDVGPKNWDPMLLDVDFASMHFYPWLSEWEYMLPGGSADYLTFGFERYHNQTRFYDRHLRKPYIVSETSFSGEQPISPNGTPNPFVTWPEACWGNEAAQDAFVQSTFPAVRDSRAAGYGWWLFHNVHWAENPNSTNVNTISLGYFKERYFGLLRFGNASLNPAPGLTGWEQHRKLAAQTFADWTTSPPPAAPLAPAPSTLDMDDRYFNPFLHPPNAFEVVNPSAYGTMTGHVQDQFGNPIAGAVIDASAIVGIDVNDDLILHRVITYTDDNGDFEIRGFDTQPDNFGVPGAANENQDRVLHSLDIGAYGCSWRKFGWWGGEPFVQNGVYELNSVQYRMDPVIEDVTIALTDQQDHQGVASLTARNVDVQGSLELSARYEVHLEPGFHAALGSSGHFFTEPVFLECDEVGAADLRSASIAPLTSIIEDGGVADEQSIDLDFHGGTESVRLSITPNPASEVATIGLTGSVPSDTWRLVIYDAEGRCVEHQTCTGSVVRLSTNGLMPGSYRVRADLGSGSLSGNFIKH